MRLLIALAGGAALPFALAPFDLWPLALVAVAALSWSLEGTVSYRTAFVRGWLFGVGKYGVGASWIYVSIHVHGSAPPLLAAFLVVIFVAGLALFSGVLAVCVVRLRAPGDMAQAVSFTSLYVLFEWLLTWFLTGFPWLFVGYAFLDTPLAALAPVGGVLLVSFAAIWTAAFLRAAIRKTHAVLIAALPWLLAWGVSGVEWVSPGEKRTVALVQGNVAQEIKWARESVRMILDRYASMSEPVWNRDLVVWPEAAITVALSQAGPYLDEMAKRTDGALLLGVPIVERSGDDGTVHYNGAAVVGDGGGRYAKRQLVPFGDYVPFASTLRGLITFFDLPMSTARAGDWQQPLLTASGMQIATAICYEVVYGSLVARDARQADVIVTISNDTWFGESIGPLQHMQMARMRALETGRYVLRGTNNGVTAIVAPDGSVVSSLPQFVMDVLVGEIRIMSGQTLYVRWLDYLVVGLCLALLLGTRLRAR